MRRGEVSAEIEKSIARIVMWLVDGGENRIYRIVVQLFEEERTEVAWRVRCASADGLGLGDKAWNYTT